MTTAVRVEFHEPGAKRILTRARRSIASARFSLQQLREARVLDEIAETVLDDRATMLNLRRAELLLLCGGLIAWKRRATAHGDA